MNNNAQRGKRKKFNETGFEMWGGYMSAKISKLENQFKDGIEGSQGKKGIFSGIAIFVNGYTNPTGEELKRIMLTHGGTFHHYYSRGRTTHTIASNLPNTKIQNMNTDFIVEPKWITDSLEAGKLLDYKKYLLYTHQNRNQPKLKFNNNESDRLMKIEENVCEEFEPTINGSSSSSLESEAESNILNFQEIDQREKEIFPQNENILLLSENTSSESSTDGHSKRSVMSTANPKFLSEYYNNSRLHHISTAGAMFKEYVKELQEKEDNFTGREYLKNWLKERNLVRMESEVAESSAGSRTIMHIDMDCFFVSVGLIKHPELQNQPVVVTHATKSSQPRRDQNDFKKEVNHFKRRFKVDEYEDSEDSKTDTDVNEKNTDVPSEDPKKISRKSYPLMDEKSSMSEIASCSYEARKKGLKNGMFLGVALKLCPELQTIPYDFEGYQTVSMNLYDIVASYTKNIEAVSCDEMYVDLGDILTECRASPLDFASCIREQIQEKTKCPCSVGIGPNMVTARMTTKKAKPNGQFLLELSQVPQFMQSQLVTELPGVGGSLSGRLEEKGVVTCGDLQHLSLSHLQSIFGERTGRSLHDLCRGIDDRPINKQHQRKSVSAEINYGIRFETWNDTEKFMSDLSEEVVKRMTKIFVMGRTITLKLKVRAKDAPVETAKFMGHGICDNVAKSITLCNPTADKMIILRESLSLLRQVSVHPKDMRGVGIQVSKLESNSGTSVSTIKDFFSAAKNLEAKFTNESKSEKHSASNKVAIEVNKQNEISGKITKRADKYMDKWVKRIDNTKEQPSNIVIEQSTKEEKTIDMDVLNSLPSDMRQQVLEEYKSLGYNIPSYDKPNLSPQPGPSNVVSYKDALVQEVEIEDLAEDEVNTSSKPENTKTLADISYSQIDESFLNALPNDIKNDLQKDFEKLKNNKENSQSSNFKTPSPSLPTTNHLKKKRGRPRGSQNKSSKSNLLPNKKQEFSREGKRNDDKSDFQSRNQVENSKIGEEKMLQCTTSNFGKTSTSARLSGPNLCGESELDSIKTLISQWIFTCETPIDIDLGILTEFCTSLISEKDLEKLDLILKFMNRKIKCGSFKWKEAFDCILETVQQKMVECHAAPLRGFIPHSINM